MDLAALPALEIARLVRARKASPVEVIEEFLGRIARVNPAINAYISLREEAARAEARALEQMIARGEPTGPLAGVPFSVKDLVATEDAPMTLGSRALADFRPGFDSVLVRRMKNSGAILLGKTNTPELGARPTTENDLFGATHNPWNLERTSGGSSGGAAAACAAGLSPLAEGSDGGGSIRIPAACCGVYGLKPARGRVTMAPIAGEGWGGLSTSGPIARTVADAAAMLDIIAGPSTGDPYWAAPPSRSFSQAARERPRLRIAVWTEFPGIATDPEMAAAVRETGKLLSGLGHKVFETVGPPVAPLEEPFLTITTVGIGSVPLPAERLELLEPRNRLIFSVARATPAPEYARALFTMHALSRAVVAFFDDVDLLLCPTLTRTAPVIGEVGADPATAWQDYRAWHPFTYPFNMTGQPAASIPAGFDSAGLPIGVQLVGRPADERAVISVSAEIEEARPWAGRLPPVW